MTSQVNSYTKTGSPRICIPQALKKFMAADFGSRSRNTNKHQSQDLNKCNCLQTKSKSEWMELSAKLGQLQLILRKKNTLTRDFVPTMENCCLHPSFMYFRETCIFYTVSQDQLLVFIFKNPLLPSSECNIVLPINSSLFSFLHHKDHFFHSS